MTAIEIYKKNFTPPDWGLKEIGGGRLKGMTDINPQWRIEALTETFGLCGFGWKYVIEKTWLEGTGNEVSAFAKVNLFIKQEIEPGKFEWSESIPGIGGSSFITIESKGPYQSDECFKMAITDALSVCCKMIGIGGKVYLGSKYDKYTKEIEDEKLKQEADKKLKEDLKIACENILKSTTIEQATNYWANNKHLQKYPEYIKAAKDIGAKLSKS